MKMLGKALLAAVAVLLPTVATAQTFPAKPIKFVVGFPAGSSIDEVSRVVMDDIRKRTGAVIVIDNRPGCWAPSACRSSSRPTPTATR